MTPYTVQSTKVLLSDVAHEAYKRSIRLGKVVKLFQVDQRLFLLSKHCCISRFFRV